MSNEALLTTMLENFVEKNINKFLNTKKEGLQDISVDNICPQNKYSSRPGGRMVIKYFDENKHLRKKIFWIKKLEEPKKFFHELSSVYSLLTKYGLHINVSKPYLYNLELGVVFIDNFSGTSLVKETLKHSFSSPFLLSEKFIQLFYDLGKWLQQFHEVMATSDTIGLTDILNGLYFVLERDEYFDDNQKKILQKHLHKIENHLSKKMAFTLVRSHNDFSLRNIIISNSNFGIIDWDAMIHPVFPDFAPAWNEVSFFLINLQGMLRFYPLVSRKKVNKLKESFLKGYFEESSMLNLEHFNELLYIFTLRYFLGIDSDRTLPQIYRPNFGGKYIKMLENSLLSGNADVTMRRNANL